MQYKELDAKQLKQAFRGAQMMLGNNKPYVDSLNVFPVPDGDTGTNMHLTITAAINEMEKENSEDISSILKNIATGALMGARGNSGVILSQLFRGFGKDLQQNGLDAFTLATAFQRASDMAYRSVIKPVEGTILTVAKATAEGAKSKAQEGGNCLEVLLAASYSAEESLRKTPQLLPVLAEAGVVDAGGQGWVYILHGMIAGIQGEILVSDTDLIKGSDNLTENSNKIGLHQELEFRYCAELIIRGQNLLEEPLKEELASLGDSLMVVGNEEVIKVHIHTNSPGRVLEIAVTKGSLHDIKIDNMEEQHRETLKINIPTAPLEGLGVVAVTAGAGLAAILESLGVDVIIQGGQTMNPSTEEILVGIRQARYKNVIIMPNNKNIILAAEQAQKVSEEQGIQVSVVPTTSFPQCLSAMLAFNPMDDLQSNTTRMSEAIKEVDTGEVTFAVRDSQYNGLTITKGEILGLLEGNIVAQGKDLEVVAMGLLEQLVKPKHELLSIFYGEDIKEAQASQLKEQLEKRYLDLDVEIHRGGQPLYYYILGLE
ncbi:MAG: DAK2 domain-containing protein [Bacillota bacterium]